MTRTGSDGYANAVGLWLEPAVPSLSVLLLTDSDVYDNTAGFLIIGSDVTFAFYFFIIDFNLYFLWNQVSLYMRYVDDRYINIKHYKCYGYNSNILIQISIPQNKKEMFSDFTDCAMLLGLLIIIWRAALGHTGPCTSWIVQWKILHLFPIPRLR